jgi:hypothetical protein
MTRPNCDWFPEAVVQFGMVAVGFAVEAEASERVAMTWYCLFDAEVASAL